MLRIIAALFVYLGLASAALAQQSVQVPATMFSGPIAISTATTTLVVTGVTGKRIYVTHIDAVAGGTGNLQFISGTGSTCGTGSANVSGNYNLIAQTGISFGIGNGAIWALPLGASLCAVTSAAVGMSGSISYAIY